MVAQLNRRGIMTARLAAPRGSSPRYEVEEEKEARQER
jgi:hypothetical protein